MVVFIHGGLTQFPEDQLRLQLTTNPVVTRMLAAGFAVAQATFRTYEQDVQSRAPIGDVRAVIHVLRDSPSVDGSRIAVFGGSGGGSIALELGSDPAPRAIVARKPATVLYTGMLTTGDYGSRLQMMAEPAKYLTAELRQRSLEKLRTIRAPVRILHGDRHDLHKLNGSYINGAFGGQPGAIVGDSNTAAGFDGANDKIDIPFNAALNSATAFTVECWANVVGGMSHRSPLSARDDTPAGNACGYIFYAEPGDTRQFWTGDGSQWHVIPGPAVTYGTYAHLVGTFDGTTRRFYVNGNEVGSNATAFSLNPDRPLRIGAGATDDPVGNFWFYGDVDEVAVYPTALAPECIALHYAAAFGASTPPTITGQPVSRTVLPGATVTFTAGVAGSLPLTYQWQKNEVDIPGATSAALTLTFVSTADSGSYRLRVSNLAGTATSDAATLNVLAVSDIAYKDAVLADGPVAYWRFNETSGEVADDLIGANDGAYLNSVTLGVPGYAPK